MIFRHPACCKVYCNIILILTLSWLNLIIPQDLDLRLNPVTKNEPDYRLFLVHMLPSLRKLGKRNLTSRSVGEGLEKRASYIMLCESLKCCFLTIYQ